MVVKVGTIDFTTTLDATLAQLRSKHSRQPNIPVGKPRPIGAFVHPAQLALEVVVYAKDTRANKAFPIRVPITVTIPEQQVIDVARRALRNKSGRAVLGGVRSDAAPIRAIVGIDGPKDFR
jgi:hypothetical protein